MNADRLLAHYEKIADAPDAIIRLRSFILDLAVRGSLVPQDPRDDPGLNIDQTVPAENLRPFRIPSAWTWARLHALGSLKGGGTPSKVRTDFWGGSIPWISPKDMKIDYIAKGQMSITEAAISSSAANLIEAGSVLFVVRGMILAHSFPVAISLAPVAINQDMKALVLKKPEMAEFVLRALKGLKPEILKRVQRSSHGTCRLEGSDYGDLLIPIPPLAEQRRIVAKIDELMGLCDRLKAARAGREAVRDRLAAASLGRLNAPDPETFQSDARFVLEALPALTTRPDQIKALRQTILNLAVRGKLVPQDVNDQPEPVTSADDETELEDRLDTKIPNSWRWVRVEDVADARLGKMLDKAKNKGRPFRYLRNTNVHWFEIRLDDLKSLPLDDEEFEEYRLKKGDVLICEGGHGIGRTAVWVGGAEDIVFQKALHRVRPKEHLDSNFFAQCCFAYFDAGIMQSYFTGVGIPHFTGRALAKLVFPLPPLAEQRRIVAKVDALMALCDKLEASLTAAADTRRRLLDALLAEALAPAEGRDLEAAA